MHKSKCLESDQEFNEIKSKIEEFIKQNEKHDHEYDEIQSRQSNSDNNELRSRIFKFKWQSKLLERTRSKLEQRINKYNIQTSMLDRISEKIKTAITSFNERYDSMWQKYDKEFSKTEERIKMLDQELNDLDPIVDTWNTKYRQLIQEYERLQSMIKNLNRQSQLLDQTKSEMERNVEEYDKCCQPSQGNIEDTNCYIIFIKELDTVQQEVDVELNNFVININLYNEAKKQIEGVFVEKIRELNEKLQLHTKMLVKNKTLICENIGKINSELEKCVETFNKLKGKISNVKILANDAIRQKILEIHNENKNYLLYYYNSDDFIEESVNLLTSIDDDELEFLLYKFKMANLVDCQSEEHQPNSFIEGSRPIPFIEEHQPNPFTKKIGQVSLEHSLHEEEESSLNESAMSSPRPHTEFDLDL